MQFSNLLNERRILGNLDHFLKRKCAQHNFNLKYICTNSKCIDELNCFLCHECQTNHIVKCNSNGNKTQNMSHELFSYYEVFSLTLLEDIQHMITKEDEIISLCVKENPKVINQIDTIFNTLEADIITKLRLAKDKFTNKIMGINTERQLHKLKDELELAQTELFNKNYDNINETDLKCYLTSYAHIDTQFKYSEKPNNLKERILHKLNYSVKEIENLWQESVKLKQACEQFTTNMIFTEVFYTIINH